MLRASLVLLCLVAGSRQLSIKELSVPPEVKVGEDAELRCPFELAPGERVVTSMFMVKWWWTPLNDGDGRTLIYQRLPGQAPARMHKDNIEMLANDTIVLKAVTPKDSGSYECEVSNDNEDRRIQRLIVYTEGTGPQLNVTTVEDGPDEDNDDDVVVTCEALNVAPEPDLVITVDGKDIEADAEVVTFPSEGYFSIFANVSMSRATVDDGAVFACELFYRDNTIKHEPYKATQEFEPSGTETTSEGAPADEMEATTETDPAGGGAVTQISSLAILLATAVWALQ